ncbi:hypothetical protein [Alkalibacterium kapii]|nr:hypothetical protein [Alkalibacterium kapii]
MSKYIKLSSIILFIAVIMTGFGIYKIQAKTPQPDMKIVTAEGMPKYIGPIELYGFVADSNGGFNYPTVELDNGNFTYLEERSFLKRLDFNYNPMIDELIINYRSFMRGKSPQPKQFAETAQHVVYVGSESDVHWSTSLSNQMTISVLDKETKEEKTFSVKLEDSSSYNDIRAVYTDYPSLTLLVSTDANSDSIQTHAYTFDLENPKDTLTEATNLTKEIGTNDYLYVGETYDKTERYVTLQTAKENIDSMYGYSEEITGYYAYDTMTQEVIKLDGFDEGTRLFTDNDTLYVGQKTNSGIELYELNQDDQKKTLLGEITLSIPDAQEEMSYYGTFNQNMSILNGKLYAYGYTEDGSKPALQISDINTQDALFKGTIELKDAKKNDSTSVDIIEYRLNPLID